MPKPVIFTVDDEPEVLNAIERDLRHHFGGTYRVMKAHSGAQALETTRQLKQRGVPIALFLVDERMPAMSGTEFLVEAIKLYPDACRVLLTAYADTQAAIVGINTVGLDYYLLKPWEPPEQRLYPALDDLLLDWRACAPRSTGCAWPGPRSRRRAMRSRISSHATRCPINGLTSTPMPVRAS